MSIVEDIYKTSTREITDEYILSQIIDKPDLTITDFWLLPQFPFDEWRKKHDYPRILENFKRRLINFEVWMKEYNLTDDILTDGYISSFIKHKYIDNKKDNKLHLIKVTYKGKAKHQVWDNYNLIADNEEGEEKVHYEYIKEFISYSDWCELNKIENNISDKFDRTEQNSIYEQVYLNFDLRLLKMGGIEVPVNGLGGLLRAKKIEFVNVSGLELSDVIKNNTSLEFIYCTVDNLKCNQLKINFLTFNNCSVRNVEINNSEISNWKFINSIVTGKISNSIIRNTRIWGGQFIPVFYNTEPDNIGIEHTSMKHSSDFDRTYRALYKANQDIGNYRQASKFKILELDFKRAKAEGFFNKIRWNIDKYYWEYGENPKRLIYMTILFIFVFGFLYSFFPSYFDNCIFKDMSYFEILGNTLYYSVVTFTTLGYGDIIPTGIVKFFAAMEALLGAITIGFLVVSLGKTKE